MSELVCPGCGYRRDDGEQGALWQPSRVVSCPVCNGDFFREDCTQERYDAVTAELERRTLHTRRMERVASPMTDEDRVAAALLKAGELELLAAWENRLYTQLHGSSSGLGDPIYEEETR